MGNLLICMKKSNFARKLLLWYLSLLETPTLRYALCLEASPAVLTKTLSIQSDLTESGAIMNPRWVPSDINPLIRSHFWLMLSCCCLSKQNNSNSWASQHSNSELQRVSWSLTCEIRDDLLLIPGPTPRFILDCLGIMRLVSHVYG